MRHSNLFHEKRAIGAVDPGNVMLTLLLVTTITAINVMKEGLVFLYPFTISV